MGLPMEGKCSACNNWPISPPVVIRNGVLCVDCASDYLRWREWPKEKPVNSGRYLVLTDGSTDIGNHLSYWSRTVESWSTKDAGIAFWRPIGELPGEGKV